MDEILKFFINFEVWIYLVLGGVGLFYLRKLFLSLKEWRSSVFGLEKEYAQRRFSASMSIILLLLFIGFAEFIFVTFIAPGYPVLNQIATPTMDLLATQVISPSQASPSEPLVAENQLLETAPVSEGCIPGKLEWIYPARGDEITGSVELVATVNPENIGFFKYEFSSTNGTRWVTIAASTGQKNEEVLGIWDTTQLIPGDYLLRLLVTDNQGNNLPECAIPIRVVSP